MDRNAKAASYPFFGIYKKYSYLLLCLYLTLYRLHLIELAL